MGKVDLLELKKLIKLGHREYVVLFDYLYFVKDIDNIEEIERDIVRLYPKEKDIYVELSNYYTRNNQIKKSIQNLEKYKENGGNNLEVLELLEKQCCQIKQQYDCNYVNIKINSYSDNIGIILDEMNFKFEKENSIDNVIKTIEEKLINKTKDINCNINLFKYVLNFVQKLNVENKYDSVKQLYDVLYRYIPSEQIKLKNILLNEYEIANKQIVLKSYPRKIRAELLHDCNCSCIMCKVKDSKYKMSDKEFYDLLKLMPYLQEFKIQGGEVFLDSRLNLLLDEAIKHDTQIAIITNGILLNEEILKKLSKINLELTFSIDSQIKEVYEKIRVGGNFDKLLKNLKLTNKYLHNKKTVLNMVVMNSNYKEIENMIKFASIYNFSEIHLNPVDGDVCKEENIFEYNINDEIINEIKNKSEIYRKIAEQEKISLLNRLPQNNKKENMEQKKGISFYDKNDSNICGMYCYAPFRQLFLSSNNNCGPNCECLETIEDKEKVYTNKNIENIILLKWNNNIMKKYRQAIIQQKEEFVCNKICDNNIISRKNVIYL